MQFTAPHFVVALLSCHVGVLFALNTGGSLLSLTRLRLEAHKRAQDGPVEDDVGGVTLKLAFDSNGGVAETSSEKSERFTCSESLDMVHRLRRCCDAVLVGRTTVERDDCTLTVRRVAPHDGRQPTRVIIDPKRKLDLAKYHVAQDGFRTVIYYGNSVVKRTNSNEFPNVTFVGLPTIDGKLSSRAICKNLAKEFNVNHIMVEGGPQTAMSFLKENMVDRAILVHAPIYFKDPLLSNLSSSVFEDAGLKHVGGSILGVDQVEFWSRPELPWPANPPSAWP